MAQFKFVPSPWYDRLMAHESGLLNIGYKDRQFILQNIFSRLLRNIEEKKPTVVIMPDTAEQKKTEKWLTEAGIRHLALIQDPARPLSETDLARLRDEVPAHNRDIAIADAGYEHDRAMNKMSSFYRRLYSEDIWEGMTWRQVLDSFLDAKGDRQDSVLHAEADTGSLRFTPEEYTDISSAISEALYLYNRDFEWIERQEGKYVSGASGKHIIENLDHITDQVFRCREQAVNLRDRYYSLLHRLSDDNLKEAHAIAGQWTDRIDKLLYRITKNNSGENARPGSWLKRSDPATEEIEAEIKLISEGLQSAGILKNYKTGTEHTVTAVLPEDWPGYVSQWLHTRTEGRDAWLRSVNRLNHQEPLLSVLENEAHSLISRINAIKVQGQPFEMNTLSFCKQMEYIGRLAYDLEIILESLGRNVHYYQWMAYLDELDAKKRKIIELLRRFDPSEWLEMFDSWYHTEMLARHLGPYPGINAETTDKAAGLYALSQKERLTDAGRSLREKAKSLETDVQAKYQEFHQMIFGKKKPAGPLALSRILERSADYIAGCFPVLVLSSDKIDKMAPGCYFEMISLTPEHMNLEIMQSFGSIISVFSEDSASLDATVTTTLPNTDQSLKSMSISERLSSSRALAERMSAFGTEPVILQLRKATVVSYSSQAVNDEIVRLFYKSGIKRIYAEASVEETLATCLVNEDASIFVVTENGLLNPAGDPGYFFSQRQVIHQLEKAGCHIISMDVENLLKHRQKYILTSLAPIKETTGRPEDHKSQLQLELD